MINSLVEFSKNNQRLSIDSHKYNAKVLEAFSILNISALFIILFYFGSIY
jgi:hypothetical protein